MANIIEQAEELKKKREATEASYKKLGVFKLHHRNWVEKAYQDQYGIWHDANVVDKEVEVHFVETFYYESWGSTLVGIMAEDDEGNKYFHTPDPISYGDDYWHSKGEYRWARFPFRLTIRENGERYL